MTARPKKRYIEGRYGQVHLLESEAVRVGSPPLFCLHATAYSSESLRPLLAAVGGDRHVVALDTPGYGGSDGPARPLAIADYADVLIDTILSQSADRPVDLFAYHTGASIAFDAAARHPALIRRIVAIGIPFFAADEWAIWRERLVVKYDLTDRLDQFDERWSYLVANRAEHLSLAAGFRNFVDELRAWPRGWWAHDALFAHDLAACLPRVAAPTLVINPQSPLTPMSRAAAGLLPDAQIIERPDLTGAIFEACAPAIARLMCDFLDAPTAARTHPIGATAA